MVVFLGSSWLWAPCTLGAPGFCPPCPPACYAPWWKEMSYLTTYSTHEEQKPG